MERYYLYREVRLPVSQFAAESGYYLKFLSDPSKTVLFYLGGSALAGYEKSNWGEKTLYDGSTLRDDDAFIYGGDISSVPMNTAGEYMKFHPTKGYKSEETVVFEHKTSLADYKAIWSIDKKYPSDVLLEISLTALKGGYYSLPTPTISTIEEEKLKWAVVPGFFQGNSI